MEPIYQNPGTIWKTFIGPKVEVLRADNMLGYFNESSLSREKVNILTT